MPRDEEPTMAELMGEDVPVEDMTTITSLESAPEIAEAAEQPVDKTRKPRARAPSLEEAVADIQAADDEVRLHPILTNAEVEEAKAEAKEKVLEAQRKAAKKKIVDDEMQRLRTEEGLVTGDGTKDQMVRISLDLAPHSPFIVLNHRPYYHAQTYPVPRHVAETLREIQQRGWRHQDEIDGKTLSEHYQRARSTGLSPVKGVTNAPQLVA